MERFVLTPESVAIAESEQGISHPVIAVLDSLSPQIVQFNAECSKLSYEDEQRYVSKHGGFLADAIEDLDNFPLEPLDIIAVCSKESATLTERSYAFPLILSLAYAIQGVPNPTDWKRSPRYFLENGRLPQPTLGNRAGLLHVQERLGELSANLREIRLYQMRANVSGDLLNKIGENFPGPVLSLRGRIELALSDIPAA